MVANSGLSDVCCFGWMSVCCQAEVNFSCPESINTLMKLGAIGRCGARGSAVTVDLSGAERVLNEQVRHPTTSAMSQRWYRMSTAGGLLQPKHNTDTL